MQIGIGGRGLVASLALVVGLAAPPARAQGTPDELGIERFQLASDRDGLLDVEWAGVPEHLAFSAGVFVGFAHDPLVVYDRDHMAVEAVVDGRLTTGIVGALGLWDRIAVSAGVDIVGYQHGTDTMVSTDLPAAGIGDVRLAVKALLAGDVRFQLSLVPTLTLPGGSARGFLREPGPTFAPIVAASLTQGKLRAAANVGYRFEQRFETSGLVSDDEAFARVGVGVQLPASAELWWSTSLAAPIADADQNQIALEMLAGATRAFSPAVSLFVAGGVGLENGFGTPDWRALAGVRFETGQTQVIPEPPAKIVKQVPVDLDRDDDGLEDAVDRCPEQVEDKDGFKDDDGCADPVVQLTGVVVDLDGRPIRGATVTIEHAGGAPIELVTGDDGRFTTELPEPADVMITAKATEYTPVTTPAHATVEASTLEIKLARAVRQGQLRGQVLSFAGKPITATIKVHGKSGEATVTTDADGQFTAELPEGSFEVVIEAEGFVTQRRTVNVKLDGVTVLNVDLRAGK